MVSTARYILTRVLIGVAIGLILLFARQASAQSCPDGQQAQLRFSSGSQSAYHVPSGYPANGTVLPAGTSVTQYHDQLRPTGQGCDGRTSPPRDSWQAATLTSETSSTKNCGSPIGNGTSRISFTKTCVAAPPPPPPPPPPNCAIVGNARAFWTTKIGNDAVLPGTACSGGCTYDLVKNHTIEAFDSFSKQQNGKYEQNGSPCDQDPPQPFTQTPPTLKTPAGDYKPDEELQEQPDANCGVLNGQPVCLDKPTGTGQCTRLPSGAGFCVTAAPGSNLQPDKKPQSGNPLRDKPGQPNDITTNTNTLNPTTSNTTIYPPSAFTTSTNYGCNGGQCAPNQAPGEAEPEDPAVDLGGEECDPATQQCGSGSGSGAFKGRGGTARTFSESLSATKAAWEGSPAMEKIGQMQIPSGGTCPSPTIVLDYFNTAIVMDAHCTVAAGIRDELRAVFLAIWTIIAVGIFLRP